MILAQMRHADEVRRFGHRCYWSGLPSRCERTDTKPVLLTTPEGEGVFWYCPLHYSNPEVEQSWLGEGWGFAY